MSGEAGESKRMPLFDVVKALMLVWVIWGHLGLYGIVSPCANALPYVTNAKIGMNMPVFFMIGGYFAAASFGKNSFVRSFARCICFMWPQIVYALFGALVAMLLMKMDPLAVFTQIMSFWFLRCFAMIYLMAALVFSLCKTDLSRWMMFALFYLALLFCPFSLRVWWMDPMVHMVPYFVFGLMVLVRRTLFKNSWIAVLCGLVFFAVIFLEGNSDVNGMNFWRVNTYWRIVLSNARNFVTFFARTLVGITGSIFLLWTLDRCLTVFPRLSCLSAFGTTTLGVYVIHEWILMMAGSHVRLFPLPGRYRWVIAIAYFLLCHFAIVAIKSCGLTKRLFFGDERALAKWIEKGLNVRGGLQA